MDKRATWLVILAASVVGVLIVGGAIVVVPCLLDPPLSVAALRHVTCAQESESSCSKPSPSWRIAPGWRCCKVSAGW